MFVFISFCIAFTSSSISHTYPTVFVSILITSVLNSASHRLGIFLLLSSFSVVLICSFIWDIFLISTHFLHCKGWGLRYSPRLSNPSYCVVVLYVGEGSERDQYHLLGSCPPLVTSPATHKRIAPFWCSFLGGWVCVSSRTLWVLPRDFPMRVGISPAAATPAGFYSQMF